MPSSTAWPCAADNDRPQCRSDHWSVYLHAKALTKTLSKPSFPDASQSRVLGTAFATWPWIHVNELHVHRHSSIAETAGLVLAHLNSSRLVEASQAPLSLSKSVHISRSSGRPGPIERHLVALTAQASSNSSLGDIEPSVTSLGQLRQCRRLCQGMRNSIISSPKLRLSRPSRGMSVKKHR
jgi:hypothetical protein